VVAPRNREIGFGSSLFSFPVVRAKLPGRDGVIFPSLALQSQSFVVVAFAFFGLILCTGARVLSIYS